MAALDPAHFTTSAEVFSANHTLPQIRALHNAIHVQIDDKASRLRTQVGGSYRDLLGTADAIVRMRGENQQVQELLSQVGGRCGRGIIDRKAQGLRTFVETEMERGPVTAARVKLLEKCCFVIGRILRGGSGLDEGVTIGDRLVLAAKVFVLGRLVVKSLGEIGAAQGLERVFNISKKALGDLRRRLLRAVERQLGKVDTEISRDDVLKALSAYSLINSSGARDVLRHFYDVRGKAVALSFDHERYDHDRDHERSTKDVVRSLQLYTQTLLDVQAFVPVKLAQTLQALKRQPLLADVTVRQIEELRLDTYEQWCGEDIPYYTPFIRHDDLDGKQARESLGMWAEAKGEILQDGLKKALQHMTEFKTIIDLRTDVLRIWIRDGGRVRGLDSSDMRDELRDIINNRVLAVVENKVHKLRLVGSEVQATLENWQSGATAAHANLWDTDGYVSIRDGGAEQFLGEVVTRMYGRNDAVSKALHCYSSWFHIIDDVKEVVESLTKQRWDNDYEEIEDEETIEERQQLLSKDDPKMLQEKMDTTLEQSFHDLDHKLKQLWETHAQEESNSVMAMYLLRVLRDIRKRLPKKPSIAHFGLPIVPALHDRVSAYTAAEALKDLRESGLVDRRVAGRPLWEGEPSLPGQPSPYMFRFLRTLSLSMADVGIDIWSPAAVKVLKQHLSAEIAGSWKEALVKVDSAAEPSSVDKDDDDDGEDNEEEEEDGSEEQGDTSTAQVDAVESRSDLLVQWYFDLCYLQSCMTSSQKDGFAELDALQAEVGRRTPLQDDKAIQRITKSANEYWQRTNLLFGILA